MRKGKTVSVRLHHQPILCYTQRTSEAYYFWKLLFGKSYYGRMGNSQDFVGFHSGNAFCPSKWGSETHPGKRRRAISTMAKPDLPFLRPLSKLHCDRTSQNKTGRAFPRPTLTAAGAAAPGPREKDAYRCLSAHCYRKPGAGALDLGCTAGFKSL